MFSFFFKQKTAYEMRISDWSSDVCSSDLGVVDGYRCAGLFRQTGEYRDVHYAHQRIAGRLDQHQRGHIFQSGFESLAIRLIDKANATMAPARTRLEQAHRSTIAIMRREDEIVRSEPADQQIERSEEHTSELQSLMRNSYAVFCLQ